jgi:AraC-like DNA-binding protein
VLHDRGDECEWFRVRTDLLRSAAWAYDAGAHDREPGALFPFAHGPGGAREFLGQRRVYRAALAGGDPLEIEEAFLTVLARVVGDAYRFRGGRRPARPDAATARAHARATEEAKKVLALRFRERLTLDVISDAVELSPFHLCRVFRAHTGRSIHRYVTSLRVRSAVERLEEGGTVREGAEWAGFSSHGHFTNAFVREFGVTPRSLQRRPGPTLG